MPVQDGTAVNNIAVQDTAQTESASVETNNPTADDAETDNLEASFEDGEGFDDEADDKQETESEESEQQEEEESSDAVEEAAEETEAKEEPQTKGEKRKDQLNTEIRDLVSERNQLRQQVEQLNAEVYKPASVEELLEQENPATGENFNRIEAQLESMRQEREVEKYNNYVTEQRTVLLSESQRALRDFPMFDESNSEYNKGIAAQADQILERSLIFDPNTRQVIGSHISPYNLYKTLADTYSAAATAGQVKGRKATEKMLIATDPVAGGHQKAAKSDEGFDAFDQEAGRY